MKFDVTLRSLIARGAPALIRQISGVEVAAVLPTEFPETRDQRVDTLVRLVDGRILHIEWQADFDAEMPWRMLRYRLLIHARYPGVAIEQVVIQVGGKRRIAERLEVEGLACCYRVIDARAFDPAPLLASPALGDNILSVVFGQEPLGPRLRAILARLAPLDERARRDALTQLLILSGLRGAVGLVLEEVKAMPLLVDIEQDPYLAALARKNRAEGHIEGRAEGEATFLIRLIEKRLGPLPPALRERVLTADAARVEAWFDRAIGAQSLEAVFGEPPTH